LEEGQSSSGGQAGGWAIVSKKDVVTTEIETHNQGNRKSDSSPTHVGTPRGQRLSLYPIVP
jgi:hypothetical protein